MRLRGGWVSQIAAAQHGERREGGERERRERVEGRVKVVEVEWSGAVEMQWAQAGAGAGAGAVQCSQCRAGAGAVACSGRRGLDPSTVLQLSKIAPTKLATPRTTPRPEPPAEPPAPCPPRLDCLDCLDCSSAFVVSRVVPRLVLHQVPRSLLLPTCSVSCAPVTLAML